MNKVIFSGICSAILLANTASADPVNIPPEAWGQLAKDLQVFEQPVKAGESQTGSSGINNAYNEWSNATTLQNSPIFNSPNSTTSIGQINAGTPVEILAKSDGRYSISSDEFEGWVDASALGSIGIDGMIQGTINELISKVAQLQQKYQSNQYFAITGFAAEISIPPSVSINFEIRKDE